jgi:hypothetical protein
MVKAKLTRVDGSVLELEGTSAEVAAVLAWERPPMPLASPQPIVITPIPYQPPAVPYGPFPYSTTPGITLCGGPTAAIN